MQKCLGVPHFELVYEGVKVKLNSVNLTEFSQGVLVTNIMVQSEYPGLVQLSYGWYSVVNICLQIQAV